MRAIQRFLANVRIVEGAVRRKPALLPRLATGFVAGQVRRDPRGSLRVFDVALGYACNFRCQHCSALALDRPKAPMLTLEDYRRVARQASDMGVLLFHFTGGEPLLRRDLLDVVRCFEPDRHLISLQSNGWMVDEGFLAAYREAGGDFFCASVDSTDAGCHDAFRGRAGAWERAIAALKLAKAAGLEVMVSTVVTHQNLHGADMRRMIDLARELGATLELNLAVPAGEWRGNADDLLDAADRVALRQLLRDHPHVRTDFESNWKVEGCPAFKEKAYLSPYGDLLPCPFIQVAFGNVREDDLATIQARALEHPYLQAYHPICIAAEDPAFIAGAGCYEPGVAVPVPHGASPLFGTPARPG